MSIAMPTLGQGAEHERVDFQRRWLQSLLTARRETPTELAKAARLSPSTLTRFLNDPEHPHGLSDATVSAIERTTGVARNEFPDGPGGFAEPDAVMYSAEPGESGFAAAVRALVGRNSNARVPWKITARTLETAGYLPGDVVIVDLNMKPRAGDIVCAQVYDFQRPDRTMTVLRVFSPPVLVGATLDPMALKPLLVDDNTVAIKGVVDGSIRASRAVAA